MATRVIVHYYYTIQRSCLGVLALFRIGGMLRRDKPCLPSIGHLARHSWLMILLPLATGGQRGLRGVAREGGQAVQGMPHSGVCRRGTGWPDRERNL